ncbi:MAG: hypothetical protein KME03_20645 [Aphanocapsa lilacina HA4352-LM1]|jgi:type II secretory pathway pseudopilin PulG|nr:hypothetical protein [Aphanocapsa lilacina HA4352-LM1]
MRRDCHGSTFTEALAAVAIAAILAPATLIAVSSYRQSQMAAQYPVEMGRILAASRAFLKDHLRLPDLVTAPATLDAELWRQYYHPPANLKRSADQLLPDGLVYAVVRPYRPSGVTTEAFVGQIRITGSHCDRYDGDPAAACEYNVPFY